MRARLSDLADPFRKAAYVHPKFRGSWSFKAVLPALIPSMSYEGMPIANGGDAQLAYLDLMSGKVSELHTRTVMRDLLANCGQDTFAMVKLLERLRA